MGTGTLCNIQRFLSSCIKEYDCRKWDNGIMGIGRVLKEGSVML